MKNKKQNKNSNLENTFVEEPVEAVIQELDQGLTEEVVEPVKEIEEPPVEETVVETVLFKEGEELEIVFSVPGYKGIKGKFVSIDDKNNVTIELVNRTRISFKKENVQKVSK